MLKNYSYCLNPNCQKLNTKNNAQYCISCGFELLLNNRYRANKPIGQGGFGKTYLAVDESLSPQRRCVIKQFVPPNTSSTTATKLFQAEAMRLKELGFHPQIPTFYDYIEQAGQRYIVQEYIDGQNLAEELQAEGANSEAQVWELLKSILSVLQFIHHNQTIHRDIKPENIIRRASNRLLVLVDFGAAKYATATILTHTGTTIGSAAYTAPEQLFGKATFVSDLYSLGVTCIHLLTQVEPFDLYSTSEDKWVWRDYLVEPVSPGLSQVLDKLLEKATSKRYQSVAAVLAELETVVKTQHFNLSTFSNIDALSNKKILFDSSELKNCQSPIDNIKNENSAIPEGKECNFLSPTFEYSNTSLKDYYSRQELKADLFYQPCPAAPIHQQELIASKDIKAFDKGGLKLKLTIFEQLTIKFVTLALAVNFRKIGLEKKIDKLPHQTGNWW